MRVFHNIHLNDEKWVQVSTIGASEGAIAESFQEIYGHNSSCHGMLIKSLTILSGLQSIKFSISASHGSDIDPASYIQITPDVPVFSLDIDSYAFQIRAEFPNPNDPISMIIELGEDK